MNPGGIIGFKKNDNVIIYPQDEYFFVDLEECISFISKSR